LAALAASLLLVARPAGANPAVYVATPSITQGEREVELTFGAQRLGSAGSATGNALSFGYGVRDWWAVEFALKGHRDEGQPYRYDAWEVENRFALTEPGEYPVDFGLLLEVERPADRTEGYELRYGPLLQTQWGPLQANLNLLLERHLRAATPPAADFTYEWQLRWRSNPRLDWGLQGFGETGPWRHWSPASEQSHQIGPAAFGRTTLSPGAALKYDGALLFGSGGVAPKRALRLRLEYEFF
jgi:hypothetical protein